MADGGIIILGISTLLAAGCKSSRQILKEDIKNQVKNMFPDFDETDLSVATDYYLARETNTGMPEAKAKLLDRVGYLYQKAINSPQGSNDRISALRELINMQKIIRGSIRVSEVKTAINYKKPGPSRPSPKSVTMKELYDNNITDITPEELPREVKNILKHLEFENGRSYWQFVTEEVSAIVFSPYLEKTIQVLAKEQQGTNEELTRTATIDPLGEMFDSPSPAWHIAAGIIDEALHIRWYHRNGDDLTLVTLPYNERNSTIGVYNFYKKLLNCGNDPHINLSKTEREKISSKMGIKKSNIESSNKKLGYVDYLPHDHLPPVNKKSR